MEAKNTSGLASLNFQEFVSISSLHHMSSIFVVRTLPVLIDVFSVLVSSLIDIQLRNSSFKK